MTRIDSTIVNVGFTVFASEACGAYALVSIFGSLRIHKTSTSVFARGCHTTMINFDIAIHTCESMGTFALISSWCIDTVCTIFARHV